MSDIKVNCPHCKQSLEVPEEMFGTIAECPSCNGQIQLPLRQAETRTSTLLQQAKAPQPKQRVVVQPPQQRAPVQPPQPQNSQPQKSSKTLFIVVSALVFVVLCLVAAVVVLLNRQAPAQNQIAGKTDTPPAISNSSNVGQATESKQTSLPASEPKVQKKGKVVVTVTWQFNKFVGTKPDTDAIVVLIPKTYKQKLKLDYVDLSTWAIVAKENLLQDGIFIEKVNGQGRAVFNRVPVGQYTCAIQSKNTKAYQRMAKLTVDLMAYLFECKDFSTELHNTIINKFSCEDVTVDESGEIEVSHDFGNTDV